MSDFQNYRKALLRHFDSELARLSSKDSTIDQADPTARRVTQGYVSFMYDPWAPKEQVALDGSPGSQTYEIAVDSVWGDWVHLTRPGETEDVVSFFVERDPNLSHPDPEPLEMLNRLLDGAFGKTAEEAEQNEIERSF